MSQNQPSNGDDAQPGYAPPQPQYAPPQPQYQQPYGQQAPYQVYPPAAPTNVLAIVSMIASIVGFFTFAIFAVAGVIMGHISLNQIKRTGENGRGMAIAGLIVGYAAIGFWVLILLFYVLIIVVGLGIAGASSGSF
ncbi:DUF4190 domain-containing protein [Leucobacter tenebrionis]|uniref:DUF4190 domain-containing protein n=1 Tax=Leucobacter tenebrionis TaxID=2873270 RepID=UPI002105FAAF|nr:DUF4190 domain-containing protein [Leucobacter tenebrionis]